jgi:hypothetical protein
MPATKSAKDTPVPTKTLSREERIRQRAYERYLQRATSTGSDLDDWLQADAEI